jgi:hypothetical protein
MDSILNELLGMKSIIYLIRCFPIATCSREDAHAPKVRQNAKISNRN